MLPCPACETESLSEEKDRSGVAFDLCSKCRGIWLDSGELSTLLGRPAAEGLLDFKPGARKCIRCSKPMLRGSFISPALIVDRCAPCGGLWLDASELRVVRQLLGVEQAVDAERAKPSAPPAAAPAAPQPEPEPKVAPLPPVGLPVGPQVTDLPGTRLEAASRAGAPAHYPGWMLHAAWWLILGAGCASYGWKIHRDLEILRVAGGDVGNPKNLYLSLGVVMMALGAYFLFTQPADAADGYLGVLKALMTPRGYRYRRRYRWYEDRY